MVSIEDIPAEQRWEIAARAASAIPFAYDIAFREAIGEKYDEIEQPIYLETAYQTYSESAIENLNPGFTQQVNKRMCCGDLYCEMVIERRK
jgi:hypothetical protein